MRAIMGGVLAWILGAVVAIGVGMLALSRIGYGVSGDKPRPITSEVAGERPLVPAGTMTPAPTSPTATPAPTPSISPSAPPKKKPSATPPREVTTSAASTVRALTSSGGTASVRCSGGSAFILFWTPRQGYHVDDVRRGPAAEVLVKFEGAKRDVFLEARCVRGVPQGESRVVADAEEDEDEE